MRRFLFLAALTLFGCGPQLTLAAHQSRTNAGSGTSLVVQAQPPQPLTVTLSATNGGVVEDPVLTLDATGMAVTQLTSALAGEVVVTAKAGSAEATTTVTFLPTQTLRFSTSPGTTQTQNLLRPIPTVVMEESGAPVTSASGQVTVSVTPGSCNATLDATSLTTATFSQGTASFPGLKITTPATGCTLTTSGGGLTAVSLPFDVQ